ncbi:DMT family transporter [Aureimonas leprariae]|uniref:DMT family transporter n=2 Tax=Plantimonas leprariae TaxID=2615207 RepID=A0A7V7PMF5_9HYPH|nr:DMT family transporter [Aureimonas leprariae]
MRTKTAATVLGTFGVVLWATETALITFTTAIPPMQTVGLAFAFAALLSPLVWLATGDDPRAAFRQPLRIWLFTVGSLVGYHACIYYATQKAPPAAAALLQGTTPLIIVLGSALLPGERLRWWHVAGAGLGLAGILLLIGNGSDEAAPTVADPAFYLAVVGTAAALWGLYSVVSRFFGDVPTSALGAFYAASAVVSLLLHAATESWVAPLASDWAAIAALGMLPMGLALFFWDYGVKRGDIQALGAISYVEPFIGAALVAAIGHGELSAPLLAAGCLVVTGAALASRSLLQGDAGRGSAAAVAATVATTPERTAEEEIEAGLLELGLGVLDYLAARQGEPLTKHEVDTVNALIARLLAAWNALDRPAETPAPTPDAVYPDPLRREAA